ncbi:MAG TPA: hypothetical protein VIH75_06575 [Candidatus Sulfotelmatobacter sp.]
MFELDLAGKIKQMPGKNFVKSPSAVISRHLSA